MGPSNQRVGKNPRPDLAGRELEDLIGQEPFRLRQSGYLSRDASHVVAGSKTPSPRPSPRKAGERGKELGVLRGVFNALNLKLLSPLPGLAGRGLG